VQKGFAQPCRDARPAHSVTLDQQASKQRPNVRKALTKAATGCYYFVDGGKLMGAHSGLSGDVTDCEITDDERSAGVVVADLIDEA
jgi:hypothetical protein